MAEHTIEDPDQAGQREAAADGRLWLGSEFAGEKVEFAVRIIEEDDDDDA